MIQLLGILVLFRSIHKCKLFQATGLLKGICGMQSQHGVKVTGQLADTPTHGFSAQTSQVAD